MKNLIEILAYILKLLVLGMNHESAINLTAKNFGVTASTVKKLIK